MFSMKCIKTLRVIYSETKLLFLETNYKLTQVVVDLIVFRMSNRDDYELILLCLKLLWPMFCNGAC